MPPATDTLSCTGGFCRWPGKPPTSISDFTGQPVVDVQQPFSGQEFATDADVVIRWTPRNTPMILLALGELPQSSSGMLEAAVWGVLLRADSAPAVAWASGKAILGGAWQQEVAPAPRNKPLYLVAQSVQTGELEAVSAAIPFAVGQGWKRPDDACQDEGVIAGSCGTPRRTQQCVAGKCRTVCGSDADCILDGRAPGVCLDPSNAPRLCAYP
jgi:hypothetical protein